MPTKIAKPTKSRALAAIVATCVQIRVFTFNSFAQEPVRTWRIHCYTLHDACQTRKFKKNNNLDIAKFYEIS